MQRAQGPRLQLRCGRLPKTDHGAVLARCLATAGHVRAQGPRLQRRCYWLLESEDDIVLVHYLNVDKAKGRADEPPGVEPALARRMGATITSGISQARAPGEASSRRREA